MSFCLPVLQGRSSVLVEGRMRVMLKSPFLISDSGGPGGLRLFGLREDLMVCVYVNELL